MKHTKTLLLLLAIATMTGATAETLELWVDNVNGAANNPGSRDLPLSSLAEAVEKLKPGMTLHVQPTKTPYPGDIRILANGRPDARIVVDGHGSLISGRGVLPADAWKEEGQDIYSRPLKNNAWGMEHYWEGGFPLVWFNGKAAENVTSQDDLKPGAYFLYKNRKQAKTDPLHNTLFIQLPEGQTLASTHLESIIGGGGIYVAGNHVTVRNFVCEYGSRDGFSTHRNKDVVFENIEARYFMDQGISNHGAQATVRNGHFHHNAGCGIVDVYDECEVRYENCLIENDTWRGGVELLNGTYEMVDCVIRGNAKKALSTGRDAKVTLRNCLFIAELDKKSLGVHSGDAKIILENCTMKGFRIGFQANLKHHQSATVEKSQFLDCETNIRVVLVQDFDSPEFSLPDVVKFNANRYDSAPIYFMKRVRTAKDEKWKTNETVYTFDNRAEWITSTGSDHNSIWQDTKATTSNDNSSTVPTPEFGATLDLPMNVGPQ